MTDVPKWFREATQAPYEERSVTVDGCPIHYLQWGEPGSPALVLVHGGAAHAHWWSFLAPQLARGHHVLALDLSGHGDSGRREAYPREMWAREVMTVAEHAGVSRPPVLVGHSMGGFVCIAAASVYGERLAGAVILDSPVRRPDPEAEEGARGRAFRNPRVYATAEAALRHYRLVPEQPCENRYLVDHVAKHSLGKTEAGWTWKFDPQVFRRFTPRAIHEILPTVRCRVALFRAEFGLVTPDIGEYMFELLDRNAPVVEIPQAHHHLMLDQPLALIAALRAILADWEHSVPRRARG
ncbi:MAG: alpha/beta hydrolase [Deltaproteobacteria bacterium]|nr:alpha/beta hydrolase [Deltaproteobacteria bacterium]